jgi:2-Cys peroxiredoxin 5
VPGAFTPTCHSQAPGYIEKYDEFKAKGVNEIFIVSVNDVFVTKYAAHPSR